MKKSAKKRIRRKLKENLVKKEKLSTLFRKVKKPLKETKIETIIRVQLWREGKKQKKCRARKVVYSRGTVLYFLGTIKGDYSRPLYPPFDVIEKPKSKSMSEPSTTWHHLITKAKAYHGIPTTVRDLENAYGYRHQFPPPSEYIIDGKSVFRY